jgi:Ni,Fe-hydrogenase maturation factor
LSFGEFRFREIVFTDDAFGVEIAKVIHGNVLTESAEFISKVERPSWKILVVGFKCMNNGLHLSEPINGAN